MTTSFIILLFTQIAKYIFHVLFLFNFAVLYFKQNTKADLLISPRVLFGDKVEIELLSLCWLMCCFSGSWFRPQSVSDPCNYHVHS